MTKLAHRTKLVEAIKKQLTGVYRLNNDTCAMGQAFTYLQKDLRERGWRSMTEYNLETVVNGEPTLGWARGYGQRNFHGGSLKFGGVCTVIYRLPKFPLKMAEAAQAKGWNIYDAMPFAGDGQQPAGVVVRVHCHREGYGVFFWNQPHGEFRNGSFTEDGEKSRQDFVERVRYLGGTIEERMAGELGGQP